MPTPKNVKKPADRKPKATPPPKAPEPTEVTDSVEKPEVPDGVEVELNGHTWLIQGDVYNDWEFLEALGEVDRKRGPLLLPKILRRMLGDEQYHEALEFLRDPETGLVPVRAGSDFVLGLLHQMNPN